MRNAEQYTDIDVVVVGEGENREAHEGVYVGVNGRGREGISGWEFMGAFIRTNIPVFSVTNRALLSDCLSQPAPGNHLPSFVRKYETKENFFLTIFTRALELLDDFEVETNKY